VGDVLPSCSVTICEGQGVQPTPALDEYQLRGHGAHFLSNVSRVPLGQVHERIPTEPLGDVEPVIII
jgi:hypothetical protein